MRAAVYPASLRAGFSITFVTASGREIIERCAALTSVTWAWALRRSSRLARAERTLSEAETFPEAIAEIVAPWRYLLVEHDFAPGCPLAATVVDAVAANPDLRVHVGELLARYQDMVASVYVKYGDSPSQAADQSTVLFAALEGALILARARRDTEPLVTVERHFASRAPSPA